MVDDDLWTKSGWVSKEAVLGKQAKKVRKKNGDFADMEETMKMEQADKDRKVCDRDGNDAVDVGS